MCIVIISPLFLDADLDCRTCEERIRDYYLKERMKNIRLVDRNVRTIN
jgi:hypothetical protein